MVGQYYVCEEEKWKVAGCVNFTDLNKAGPKDHFLVPQIGQLVDAIVRHPRMSFLETFQGYHQYLWLWMIKRGQFF